jgi:signal peptide peptidase SppA
MKRRYPHVLAAFYGTPWAILPEKLREIEAVLWRRIEAGPTPRGVDEVVSDTGGTGQKFIAPDAAFDDGAVATDQGYTVVGAAAVLPIHGTITPRPSAFDDWSGGTSAERIGRAVDAAAADPKVEHIVLDIDSPGGSVFGIPEAAGKILAARKAKPVTAVANHMAASAAYWFATQANTVAVTPAGWVGSVGVIWSHTDMSKLNEQLGVSTTYITAGKFKAEGMPEFPLSEEGREFMQQMVDTYYAQFVGAVAKGRGLSAGKVEKDFGQGRVVMPADAVEARMADRIATLETVVNEVNGARTARAKRRVAADLAAAGLPTA